MSDQVLDSSREALDQGSKSFALAAKLFDARQREAATLLYAWCRHCDDAIDGQLLGHGVTPQTQEQALATLQQLQQQTDAALRGDATDDAVFTALGRVAREHELPHHLPRELLQGFAMDVEQRSYETIDDVLGYCYHVAGVVGVMMAHIMGVRDPVVLDRASDLGLALQLTNISRDVVEDAELDRVYLPSAWLDEEGIPAAEVALPRHRPALARVVARLLDVAEAYYASGDIGMRYLPLRSAWAVAVARGVYSRIGHLVRSRGVRAWDRRAIVSKPTKLTWVVRGLLRAMRAAPRNQPVREGLWTRPTR